jgi:uncharacterized protein (DUF58 family)
MVVFALLLALIVLGLIATAVLTIWGIPFVILFAVILAAYLIAARRKDPSVGRLEHSKPKEPTGIPRKGTGDAQTSNERVGQS